MHTIGKLSRAAECRIETIRYYEKRGLMPIPSRSAGGHRLYGDEHVRRLKFIRRGRALGFTLEQIGELLDLSRDGQSSCGDALQIVDRHLNVVNEKLMELEEIKRSLTGLADNCRSCCPSAQVPDCTIMEDLAR